MAELQETHTIFGPFQDADPVDTARIFFRTNGYELVSEERGEPPGDLVVQARSAAAQERPEEEGEEVEEVEAADEAEQGEGEEAEEDEGEEAEEDEEDEEDEGGTEDEAPEEEEPEQAEEQPSEILIGLKAERGRPGRGWFSSNLTELHTTVTVRLTGNKMVVDYTVDTTGQHLWDEEREFWRRESKALEGFLLGDETVPNLVEEERARATAVRRDMIVMGLWIGGVVAVVLFIAAIVLFRD